MNGVTVVGVELGKVADILEEAQDKVIVSGPYGRRFHVATKQGYNVVIVENGVTQPIIVGLDAEVQQLLK